ncbi:hypothetical protein [Paraburkholderia sp. 35.1]
MLHILGNKDVAGRISSTKITDSAIFDAPRVIYDISGKHLSSIANI